MKTLAKYNACNHCVIGENTFKNMLIVPGELPGPSRNGPLAARYAEMRFRAVFHWASEPGAP